MGPISSAEVTCLDPEHKGRGRDVGKGVSGGGRGMDMCAEMDGTYWAEGSEEVTQGSASLTKALGETLADWLCGRLAWTSSTWGSAWTITDARTSTVSLQQGTELQAGSAVATV